MEPLYISDQDFRFLLENSWDTDLDYDTLRKEGEIYSVRITELEGEEGTAQYDLEAHVNWEEDVDQATWVLESGNIDRDLLSKRSGLNGILFQDYEVDRSKNVRKRIREHIDPTEQMIYDIKLEYNRNSPEIDEERLDQETEGRVSANVNSSLTEALYLLDALDDFTGLKTRILERIPVLHTMEFTETNAENMLVMREKTEELYSETFRAETTEEYEDVLIENYLVLEAIQDRGKNALPREFVTSDDFSKFRWDRSV